MVSVTGASWPCAASSSDLPAGTLLDDVYWPLAVAMGGFRVDHDERARAFDRLPERARDEFRRKVRTLAGNFQLMARMPAALCPGATGFGGSSSPTGRCAGGPVGLCSRWHGDGLILIAPMIPTIQVS